MVANIREKRNTLIKRYQLIQSATAGFVKQAFTNRNVLLDNNKS